MSAKELLIAGLKVFRSVGRPHEYAPISRISDVEKAPYISIGKFNVSLSAYRPETHLWIQKNSLSKWEGEGSEFPIKDLERLIEDYYDKNF